MLLPSRELPAYCSTGSVVLSGDYLDSSSWKLCRHTALLAVQYYPGITWTPAVESSAGTLLYWQCSTIRGLPGLQQLQALPAHCSTGSIVLSADYMDSSSWMLCRHSALRAVKNSPRITWTPAVTSSAGTLLYWQCSTLRGLPGLQQLQALLAHCSLAV